MIYRLLSSCTVVNAFFLDITLQTLAQAHHETRQDNVSNRSTTSSIWHLVPIERNPITLSTAQTSTILQLSHALKSTKSSVPDFRLFFSRVFAPPRHVCLLPAKIFILARTWYHSMQHRVCVQGILVTSGLLRTKKIQTHGSLLCPASLNPSSVGQMPGFSK